LDDLSPKCGNYIKMTLAVREVVWESANWTVWRKLRRSVGLLWTWHWTFKFYKSLWICVPESEIHLVKKYSAVFSGVPRNFVWGGGEFNKFSWGQRTKRTGIWGQEPPSQGFWRQL
jgi:hypothetical protein